MKRIAVALLVIAASARLGLPARAAVYEIDPYHSSVSFKVRHLMITKVPGKFSRFAGWFEYDEKDMKVWKASATIEAASIDTGIEKRDGHLRAPDFLDAAKYPSIEFRSTGIKEGKGGLFKLKGDLTLRGVTKPIELDLALGGMGKDPQGGLRAGFAALGKINRTDFGVQWNMPLETGGVLVSEEVEIMIEVEGIQKR